MVTNNRGASAGFSAPLSFIHSLTDKDKIKITKLKTRFLTSGWKRQRGHSE